VSEASSSTDWKEIRAGKNCHSAGLKNTGQIWTWGANNTQQLGISGASYVCSPVRERSSSTNWCGVDLGNFHTAAINTSGQIWGWGGNQCGSLATGTTGATNIPVREICSASDWCSLSTNECRTAAIKTSGQLWGWGRNACGGIGDGTLVAKCSPVREFCSATDWCRVAVGYSHNLAIKSDGSLWAWGNNNCGQLGDGTTVNKCSPVREICSATDWSQVAGGFKHSAALKTSGQIWSWGSGTYGSLGVGNVSTICSPVREFTSSTNWCSISSSSSDNSQGLKTDGTLWAWGGSFSGQLGEGTPIGTHRCSPVREITRTDWCFATIGSGRAAGVVIR
jgi:alpha-tubulin suppressor-like RCC1 family protein